MGGTTLPQLRSPHIGAGIHGYRPLVPSSRYLLAGSSSRAGSREGRQTAAQGWFSGLAGANTAIDEAPPLQLQPRGRTALYDAIGRLITDVGADLAALPEAQRPGHRATT